MSETAPLPADTYCCDFRCEIIQWATGFDVKKWLTSLPPHSMTAKSGRKVITAPTTVIVENFRPVTGSLGVISYKNANHERVDDLYNINDRADFDTLMPLSEGETSDGHDEDGEKQGEKLRIEIVLHPDGPDSDGHPEAKNAKRLN